MGKPLGRPRKNPLDTPQDAAQAAPKKKSAPKKPRKPRWTGPKASQSGPPMVVHEPRTRVLKRTELYPVQVRIDVGLVHAAQKEAMAQNRSLREVVEWALREYVYASNPRQAAKMGIFAEEQIHL